MLNNNKNCVCSTKCPTKAVSCRQQLLMFDKFPTKSSSLPAKVPAKRFSCRQNVRQSKYLSTETALSDKMPAKHKMSNKTALPDKMSNRNLECPTRNCFFDGRPSRPGQIALSGNVRQEMSDNMSDRMSGKCATKCPTNCPAKPSQVLLVRWGNQLPSYTILASPAGSGRLAWLSNCLTPPAHRQSL